LSVDEVDGGADGVAAGVAPGAPADAGVVDGAAVAADDAGAAFADEAGAGAVVAEPFDPPAGWAAAAADRPIEKRIALKIVA
jgi:hypothetical protein